MLHTLIRGAAGGGTEENNGDTSALCPCPQPPRESTSPSKSQTAASVDKPSASSSRHALPSLNVHDFYLYPQFPGLARPLRAEEEAPTLFYWWLKLTQLSHSLVRGCSDVAGAAFNLLFIPVDTSGVMSATFNGF